MALQAGLVGLPNVGKSTLFNALTKSSIPAENFPFCTIDPNTAITTVPDDRLKKLSSIFGSKKEIAATTQFVDIAGLVKGASEGEGLGNQFLSHIMQVDLIIHVVRCFEESEIIHVHNHLNPLNDFDDIIAELMLKDLDSNAKRKEKIIHQLKGAKSKGLDPIKVKGLEAELEMVSALEAPLNNADYDAVQKIVAQARANGVMAIPMLSAKPFLIAANFSDEDFSDNNYQNSEHYKKLVERFGSERIVPVSARIEAELSQLDDSEADEMRADFAIKQSGLTTLIQKTYQTLDLITFFTCGPQEAHAWTVQRNTPIPQAAGTIHSDLERGFIASEVYNARDIFEYGTEQSLRQAGKIRTEGKSYVIQDGDVIHVRFNV